MREISIIKEFPNGALRKYVVTIEEENGRIYFLKSPFQLKDDIKALQGSKWHGFDPQPRKIWSAKDCERNRFQLAYLAGENPYTNWEQPLREHDYIRPLRQHQCLMSDHMLTYHYGILAAEAGVGKTLSAIEIMERSGQDDWWWVGPKSGIKAVEREFRKWNLQGVNVEMMTYEALTSRLKNWVPGMVPPAGVVFDESQRIKNFRSQRAQAAYALANGIRETHGKNGYVILMSGTPSPKSPVDIWSQAEIAWPGFLREGDPKSFEYRLGIFVEKETSQGKHLQRVTWLDDERKCAVCGAYQDDPCHNPMSFTQEYHEWQPSINEVHALFERLDGLMLVLHKKDCLDLPEKQYRIVECEPTTTITRVAKAIVNSAQSTITGLTLLRELSDGFQYREEIQGTEKCKVCIDGQTEIWVDPKDEDKVFEMKDLLDQEYANTLVKELRTCPVCEGTCEVSHKVRIVREVPCPKEAALVELLDENEEQGRLVVFAGFTGSIDRIVGICQKQKWAVVRVDGRGWKAWDYDGNPLQGDAMDVWTNLTDYRRVVFVAHPKSGGLSLTLTESRMAVFYSNDFSAESRTQAEERIHRIGTDMNKGAIIVDLIHLPTDAQVLNVLKENRKLELMTLGELGESLNEL
jgi:hypothetical protein